MALKYAAVPLVFTEGGETPFTPPVAARTFCSVTRRGSVPRGFPPAAVSAAVTSALSWFASASCWRASA